MADDQRPDPMQSFYLKQAPPARPETGSVEPDQKVFRNQETRFMAAAFGGMTSFFALFILLLDEPALVKGVVSLALVLIALAFFFRGSQQGIYVDREGIRIRAGFSSSFVRWEAISRFELRKGVRDMITYVDLIDGSSVPARALNAGTGLQPAMRRRAQEHVDELNRILEQQQQAAR